MIKGELHVFMKVHIFFAKIHGQMNRYIKRKQHIT